jgi:hypothetical protein
MIWPDASWSSLFVKLSSKLNFNFPSDVIGILSPIICVNAVGHLEETKAISTTHHGYETCRGSGLEHLDTSADARGRTGQCTMLQLRQPYDR